MKLQDFTIVVISVVPVIYRRSGYGRHLDFIMHFVAPDRCCLRAGSRILLDGGVAIEKCPPKAAGRAEPNTVLLCRNFPSQAIP